ncbi:hypothetical protein [uncultured Robinsoniella sp.]|uniref:hypothetical protein n=1 Tax=uncultured Robinsoniella sp. TaxID=904190 RepID=UPI00374FDA6D
MTGMNFQTRSKLVIPQAGLDIPKSAMRKQYSFTLTSKPFQPSYGMFYPSGIIRHDLILAAGSSFIAQR